MLPVNVLGHNRELSVYDVLHVIKMIVKIFFYKMISVYIKRITDCKSSGGYLVKGGDKLIIHLYISYMFRTSHFFIKQIHSKCNSYFTCILLLKNQFTQIKQFSFYTHYTHYTYKHKNCQ